MRRNFDPRFRFSSALGGNFVQLPSFWTISIVRSIEVVRISEVKNTLYIWQKQSVPRHESVVRRLSVTRRVRYERFHCIVDQIQVTFAKQTFPLPYSFPESHVSLAKCDGQHK